MTTSNRTATTILTWSARISSIALAGLFLSFLFGGEPLPNLTQESLSVQLIFGGWAAIFVGYLVGWRFPMAGAVLVFAALTFMFASDYLINARLLGPAFLLWLIPGFFYLLAGWVRSRQPVAVE